MKKDVDGAAAGDYGLCMTATDHMKTYQYIDQSDRPTKSGETYFWKVNFMRDGEIDNYPSRAEREARKAARARHKCKGLEDENGTHAMAQDLTSQGFDVAVIRTIGFYA